tara:strand:- start:343 stop:840 length:498 start_codon:yes stop_codon:yes gene_type:complete
VGEAFDGGVEPEGGVAVVVPPSDDEDRAKAMERVAAKARGKVEALPTELEEAAATDGVDDDIVGREHGLESLGGVTAVVGEGAVAQDEEGEGEVVHAMLEVVEEGGLGRRGEVEAVVEVVVLLPPDVGKGKESVAAEAVVHGRIGDGQPRWRVQDGIEELHGAVS